MGTYKQKYEMRSIVTLLLLAPALALAQNATTSMPNYNTTAMPSYNTTAMPRYNTTTMPSYNTTFMPNYNSTTMPNNNTTYMPAYNTTTMPSYTSQPIETTTTAGEEFCSGHVCLPEENGFFAEGCCDNSYCQCYLGMGYLKHCDGDGVFNEELQSCDWDWHVPCCNASMPTLPTPEEKCQAIQCHEDGYFPEGTCEDLFCQCIGGVGHLQHCHDGLFFNPAISVCDWPWNNPGCSDTTDTTPDTNLTTTSSYSTTTSVPEEQCSYNCTTENGVFAEGCCEYSYCQCFGGEGFLHYCPPDSVFNTELGFCDSPASVECCNANMTTTTILSTSTTFLPSNTTLVPSNSTTPSSDSCMFDCAGQADGHYAEGDCLPSFCNCEDGEGTVEDCLMGTVFNAVLGYCTNPENTMGCCLNCV